MDVMSFVAALERNPANVDSIAKTYGGSGTAGKMVGILSNGQTADMPVPTYTFDATQTKILSSTVAPSTDVGILPTSDPDVFVAVCVYANSGNSAWCVNAFRMSSSGSITNGGQNYISGPFGPGYSNCNVVRLGTTNTYLMSLYQGTPYTVYVKAFSVNTSTLTVTDGTSGVNPVINDPSSSSVAVRFVAINNTQALFTYYDSVNSKAKGVIITASGLTLSMGTPIDIATGSSPYDRDGILIDTNKVVLRLNAKLYVLTISGTTFSVGTALDCTASLDTANYAGTWSYLNSAAPCKVIPLSTTQLLYIECKGTDTVAFVVTMSGTTLTKGSTYVINTMAGTTGKCLNVVNFGGGKFGLIWVRFASSGMQRTSLSAVLAVSGTAVTIFPVTILEDFLVSSVTYELNYYGAALLSDGVTIMLNADGARQLFRLRLTTGNLILQDNNSNTWSNGAGGGPMVMRYDKILLGTSSNSSSGLGYGLLYMLVYTFQTGIAWGVMQYDGTVVFKGISSSHLNLSIGKKYYYDVNGVISAIPNNRTFLGKAISPTEILIDAPNSTT